MKLSAWAKQQGVHYQTAWRWFKAGMIPGAVQQATGTILVLDGQSPDEISGVPARRRRRRKAAEAALAKAARCEHLLRTAADALAAAENELKDIKACL